MTSSPGDSVHREDDRICARRHDESILLGSECIDEPERLTRQVNVPAPPYFQTDEDEARKTYCCENPGPELIIHSDLRS